MAIRRMMRDQMIEKIREYIVSDLNKIEDYSDIKVCSNSCYIEAMDVIEKRLDALEPEELEAFCSAIDDDTVNYETHGCR